MNGSKLSAPLADRLANAGDGEMVDLVVELQHWSPAGAGSRAERVAAAIAVFEREAAPVQAAIQSAGGAVLETAWINQTLRARMPAESVAGLAACAEVSLLDLPRALKLAAG